MGVGLSFREKGGGEERGERPGEEGMLASLGEGEDAPSSIRKILEQERLLLAAVSAAILLVPRRLPPVLPEALLNTGGTLEFAQVISVLNATENLGRVCTSVRGGPGGVQWFYPDFTQHRS